ncbi:MAG: quinolinate synthase NadA [Candidatus Omnitrophica bacterium]|nr:quinolinate synthase NadA [Candidatus Omnitrophota bacterium]
MSDATIISARKDVLNAVILAHNYQIPEVQGIADVSGDSLELAKISKDSTADVIVFCGVRFMAETAKILSPRKTVLLPVLSAGCPLADMITPAALKRLQRENPDAWTVSYVNSSAEIKALSDVCCTSSNAVKVVRNVPARRVIFVPDRNLGWWVARNVPEKEILVWEGCCNVHEQFSPDELQEARENFPDAEILVHPECRKELLERADAVLSTSGMLRRAKESAARRFVIGTEEGMLYRLRRESPEKEFFPLGSKRICADMKQTTLRQVRESLERQRHEIVIPPETGDSARTALERMVQYL